MHKVKELSLEFVNEHFYECEGKVFRKDGRSCVNWIHKCYYYIKFNKKSYLVHRILWILYNQKYIPEGYVIDHVDLNKSNNSKQNLRLATPSENQHNSKIRKDNTTNIKGISIKIYKGYVYYCSSVSKNNKIFSKTFPYTPEGLQQATIWIEEQRERLHGEFARSE